MQAVQLYRRWRKAAGRVYGRFVPSGPFSGLGALSGVLRLPGEAHADELAQMLAGALAESEQGQMVKKGEAVFVLDLPGYLSVAVGAYLQLEAVYPVSLIAGFYQPNAVLNGRLTLENLLYYGERLDTIEPDEVETAAETAIYPAAFLLERERMPMAGVDDFLLLRVFDNRYRVNELFFPSFEFLQSQKVKSFVDVRAADDEVAPDLYHFYELAAQNGFDIFSVILPLERLPV